MDYITLRKLSVKQLQALLDRQMAIAKPVPGVVMENIERLRSVLQEKKKSKGGNEGYIYLIAAPQVGIKIGYSINPQKRLKSLKTGNPEAILIHQIACTNAPKSESLLHRYLDQYRYNREWYRLPETEIEALKAIQNEIELLDYCEVS